MADEGLEWEGASVDAEQDVVPKCSLFFTDHGRQLMVRGTTSEKFEKDLAEMKDPDGTLAALVRLDVRECRLTEFAFLDKCTSLLELNVNSNGAWCGRAALLWFDALLFQG